MHRLVLSDRGVQIVLRDQSLENHVHFCQFFVCLLELLLCVDLGDSGLFVSGPSKLFGLAELLDKARVLLQGQATES